MGVKVLFDNLFFQAPFITCYFVVTGLMEGLSPAAVFEKTQRNFHAAWAYGVLLWGPVQTLNFWIVPVPYQALVVNVVNAGWKTFLSILYHCRDYGSTNKVAGISGGTAAASEAPAVLRAEAAALRAEVAAQRALVEELRQDLREATRRLAALAPREHPRQ